MHVGTWVRAANEDLDRDRPLTASSWALNEMRVVGWFCSGRPWDYSWWSSPGSREEPGEMVGPATIAMSFGMLPPFSGRLAEKRDSAIERVGGLESGSMN